MASGRGYETAVKLLLWPSAGVNAQCECTALIVASTGGRDAVVRLLLSHGAEIKIQCEGYGTALTEALLGGHEAVAILLIENSINGNALDGCYGSPLRVARNKRNKCNRLV